MWASEIRLRTVDDRNLALPSKGLKLWEVWYIPYDGYCRIFFAVGRGFCVCLLSDSLPGFRV